jgi:uncharacterized protein (DUF305 family)
MVAERYSPSVTVGVQTAVLLLTQRGDPIMSNSTNRRRFLYALGAASTIGFVGYSAADDHADDADHDHHGDDHGHHDEDEHDHHEKDRHGADGEFNHADVMFMRMMIPHHEQAIEMAELVPGRTDREELRDLGPEIIEVQEAEIELMEEWLAKAGADPDCEMAETGHDEMNGHEMEGADRDGTEGMGHNGTSHDEMEGMMTDEEMQELRCLNDQEFDCLFVDHMIHHHEGAITMAEDALADGQADRVLDLAKEVIEVQEVEIEMMEDWQVEWGC